MSRKKRAEEVARRPEEHYPHTPWSVTPETQRGIVVIILVFAGVLTLLSLLDLAGNFGRLIAAALGIFFGWVKWAFPALLVILAYITFHPDRYRVHGLNYFGLALGVVSSLGLVHVLGVDELHAGTAALDSEGGGYIGFLASIFFLRAMGFWATLVVLLCIFVVSVLILFNTSLERVLESSSVWRRWYHVLHLRWLGRRYRDGEADASAVVTFSERSVGTSGDTDTETPAESDVREDHGTPSADGGVQQELPDTPKLPKRRRMLVPPIDLLTTEVTKPTVTDLEVASEMIRKTLENFGIIVEMAEVHVGPTVTQFTLKPADGVRLAEITALGNDLSLALAAHPIRIEAPIPGKSLVGIEVPNQKVAIVPLGEILSSDHFKKRKSPLMIALGKDVTGLPWLADLTRMPHLLVAGATGSGKSICLNSILMSLLYQNGPDDLKVILVDPKRVELPVYNGIPHLLTPVITDVKKTVNSLKWALTEMDRRFTLLESLRFRDIHAYNQNRESARLPFIVIMIDELADLMVAAGSEVEPAIIRLAQMARAVGIHLIVATQRPSVDIITGLIKANITSRVAFAVASQTDSRTILDTSGAEKLLGRGDMLFVTAELSKPKRLQGAYVSDAEIHRVVDYLKSHGEPEYEDAVVERATVESVGVGNDDAGAESDAMLPLAKDVVIRAGKASASLLQRRLRLGYARAARILDLLEEQGIIGPADGARPREVLVKHDAPGLNDEAENDIVEESSEDSADNANMAENADEEDTAEEDETLNPKP
ncbi:DNA translocase FtsK 4TM domain-containing protein [Candidatus Uhrbacteria bacterium]|nr:DNA translocase FtsK 4TM domain-containing protein [Candidatus Uhrbacteria bacterium]